MNTGQIKNKCAQDRAVVLLSGGLDSCVTATIASKKHELFALHASYGQRTLAREKKAFRDIARRINVARSLEVDLNVLAKIGASSLVERCAPVPTEDVEPGVIPSTYVPFRNGVLLAVAVAWAESVSAQTIYIGATAPDIPEGYPDTSEEFFSAFEKAAMIGTKPETKINIVAPLVNMSKKEVIIKGEEVGAPMKLTWSCYKDENAACGVCLSCKGRIKGFKEAGLEDFIQYQEKEKTR